MYPRRFSLYKGESPFEREINPLHPWVSGMMGFYAIDEGGGAKVYDVTGKSPALSFFGWGANNPWINTVGSSLNCIYDDAGANGTLPASLQSGLPLTIVVGWRRIGSTNGNAELAGILYQTAWSSPFVVFNVYASGNTLNAEVNNAGSYSSIANMATGLTDNTDYVSAISLTKIGLSFYNNGILTYSDATSRSNPTYSATSLITIGATQSLSGRHLNGLIRWVGLWNRDISVGSLAEISGSVNAIRQIYRSRRRHVFGASGIITATSAITLASDTFAGSAGFSDSASSAITLGSDTFAGSAGFSTAATMALTLASDTFAGSAGFATAATSAITLASDTFAGAGGSGALGSMAITLGADTFVGSAGFTAPASMGLTLGADTFAGAATGGAVASGTMSITLASDTFAGSAGFATTATSAIMLGSDIFVGAGSGPIVSFVIYVDPTRATVLPEDAQIAEIAPERATVLQ